MEVSTVTDHRDVARAVRRGRTAGTAILGILLSTFTAVCSVQIIQQAWAPPASPAGGPCREGALSLVHAIRRAREAAATSTEGERASILAFRKSLDPEWSSRAAIGARCDTNPEVKRMLPEIDRLRYAEEHALRYEALDVAGRRRRVERIARSLGETR